MYYPIPNQDVDTDVPWDSSSQLLILWLWTMFLDHVLEWKGFSSRWRAWMGGCLFTTNFAILVNGNAKN